MNDVLTHYKSLPRIHLQRELREITGIEQFYLWEYIGLQWTFEEVIANPRLAVRLGVKPGDVIGYRVLAGHVFGGALGDLMNVEAEALKPPYPDPFR